MFIISHFFVLDSIMYQPKSVLLTGGCGFIGSNVLNYLVENHPDIFFVNLDRMDYCSSDKSVTVQDKSNYKFVKGDICNPDIVNFILHEYDIDTVMHFAAQSHVDNSFGNSLQFTRDNVLGTHNLLECCRVWGLTEGSSGNIRRFIHVSTDEVYGEVMYDEEFSHEKSLLNPTNPYSASKAGAEFQVKAYYKSFGMPIIITRGNNVYGPRQYPEKLIPKFTTLLSEGKKVTVHGQGNTVRNFIYVSDVCRAFEKILFEGKVNEIYNVGSSDEFSVLEITQKLVKILKNDNDYEKYIEYVKDREFNDFRYAIDSKKLQELGWKKEVDFEEGLIETVKWIIENPDHWPNE